MTTWLLVLSIAGVTATLLSLPFILTAAPPTDPPPAGSPPEPSDYTPEVKQLMETTYLGHGANVPDPEEPAAVLEKYLEQNAHGYHQVLTEDEVQLDTALTEWETLAQQHPQSRHAFVGLAKHYRTKARVTGDISYTRQAADAYLQATNLGLGHGRIKYTRELSELLVELGDLKGLDQIFERI